MSPERSKRLLEGPIVSSLLVLAIPIVLGNLLQTAYQLTDAFWVGRLGGEAVAAVSVVFPVSFLAMALGMGFSIAASSMVAQYAGAKRFAEVTHAASQAMLIALVMGGTIGVVGFVLAPHIITLMRIEPAVHDAALGFMRLTFAGILFTFVFITFQSLLRGVGEVVRPMYIVLSSVLINVVIDPLFIFGWGPMPALGVEGAALATFVTQGMSALIGLYLLARGSHGVRVTWQHLKPDKAFLARIITLGIPTSLEQTTRALGMMAMVFLVTGFGTAAVAAFGVGSNVLMVVIIPALGLSMAVAALVGQNVGAGQIDRAKEIVRLGAIVAFSILAVVSVLTILFDSYIVRFFITGDAVETTTLAMAQIKIMALSFGLIGVQMAFFGVFRAVGAPGAALALTAFGQLLQFPLAYSLAHVTSLGLAGIWWSMPITNIVTAAVALWWYRRGSWQNRKLTNIEQQMERATEEILTEEGMRSV